MNAPTAQDAGYPCLYFPKGSDREGLRAGMRKAYPNASDVQIEELAKAGAMIDALSPPRKVREACFDGEIVSPAVAGELRSLGRLAA